MQEIIHFFLCNKNNIINRSFVLKKHDYIKSNRSLRPFIFWKL